jgi:formate hydrogenlyase transcriptional activator
VEANRMNQTKGGPQTRPQVDPFDLAIEASPAGILVSEPGGAIVLVNRELERQFGYSREELIGRAVDVLLPETLRGVHSTHRSTFWSSPTARQMGGGRELFGRRKDGTKIPVEIALRPIQTDDGWLVLASIADLSARRRDEESQRSTAAEQLGFERLVADLSSRFINVPPEQIDGAITEGLHKICAALDLDRGTLYRMDRDGTLFEDAGWSANGIESLASPIAANDRCPWTIQRVLAGDVVQFSKHEEIPNQSDRQYYLESGIKSAMILPLSVAGHVAAVVSFHALRGERSWSPEAARRFKLLATILDQVIARRQRDATLREALGEVKQLRDALHVENEQLRREVAERFGFPNIVGLSAALRRALEQVHQVAATDSTVLLLGETGTGKELFATQIHALSARRSRAMVRVNCAAIPATLIESELFGREKGAFTGALARQVGRFEVASGSTIFLDEIGDLPTETQIKLLRVLQERQIERLGSPQPIAVDTRIIAATHRNLEQRIAEGTFREDLYYRLNVFPIHVPPLRERLEDVPLLVWRFVQEFSKSFGKHVESIAEESMTALQRYQWPGNLRELRNVVERAMITSQGSRLTITPPEASVAASQRSQRLIDVEREHMRRVLEAANWRIRGVGGAAERLGVKPTTLETRMAKLGIKRPVK